MKYYIMVLILIVFNSCFEVNAKFEITNETDNFIDSISINSFDHQTKTKYLSLKPNETKIYRFNMINLPKVDGDYLLTYKSNEAIIQKKRFGYYSNGHPSELITKIKVKVDTVIIDQIYKNYD